MNYKRKRHRLASCIFVFLILIINCSGCLYNKSNKLALYDGFSVHYLDVCQGDCIFINFPDGKNMMIDTGENDSDNRKVIDEFLSCYSVETIDILLLTHPDMDHIGNATYILQNYQVQKVYIPYINKFLLSQFDEFDKVVKLIEQKNIESVISDCTVSITGKDYKVAFLLPMPVDYIGGSYEQLNSQLIPSDRLINNLSPIVYLECMDTRFVFTGDAEANMEKFLVNEYKAGFYDMLYAHQNIKVNLENIDYLKLSHHGAQDGSCSEFLQLLMPKNVIISVGANNFYGHPSSVTLEKLDEIVKEYNLFRTDRNGTIAVHESNEQIKISTQI